MAKSLIKKLVAGPVTLPDPFSDVILTPERPSAVVAGAPSEVIAQLGGGARVNGVLSVSEVPDSNQADAVAFGLADVQSAGTPRTSFVFSPTDPLGARENVYTDWAALIVALATVNGHKVIEFTEDATIPAGAYDMTDVTWLRSAEAAGDVTVTVADGATFTNLADFDGNSFFNQRLIIVYAGTTAAMITFSGVPSSLRVRNGAYLTVSGSQPYHVGSLSVALQGYEQGLGEDSYEIFDTTGGSVEITVSGGSVIEDNTLRGTGAANITRVDAAGLDDYLSATHANLSAPPKITSGGTKFGYDFRGAPITSGPTALLPNSINLVDPTSGGFTVTLPDSTEFPGAWCIVAEVGGS